MDNIKVGDWVEVLDEGLLMLQKFAPKGVKPNNHGRISRIMKNDYEIEFPIGDDDIEEHSQVAPYPKSICKLIKK